MPGVGSEPGAGWVWSRMIAGLGPTCVLTRPYPQKVAALEASRPTVPEHETLRIVYVDVPRWTRLWRKDVSTPRLTRLEYMLWQANALRESGRLRVEEQFDVVWHLTWANAWLGSAAALVGPPFIYGPVGGGVSPPWRLVTALGARGIAYEIARAAARTAGRYLNPLARTSWERARLILVQNPETREWLPRRHHAKTVVFPNAVLEEGTTYRRARGQPGSTLLFAGKLLPLKGVRFAIRALAFLPESSLLICGEGPEESMLRRLAHNLGLGDRVRFLGQQPREEVLRLMREEADVFLFPSLHDEGSWVVAEAAASGLPVVCLDRGGPPLLGGTAVAATTPEETVRRLADAVRNAIGRPPAASATDLTSCRARLAELIAPLFSHTGERGRADER
jgi:glycosyltransferase involved in cell wall biosynthesis